MEKQRWKNKDGKRRKIKENKGTAQSQME